MISKTLRFPPMNFIVRRRQKPGARCQVPARAGVCLYLGITCRCQDLGLYFDFFSSSFCIEGTMGNQMSVPLRTGDQEHDSEADTHKVAPSVPGTLDTRKWSPNSSVLPPQGSLKRNGV